jgi:glycosyltransferase involved in cell wall biosynthesis
VAAARPEVELHIAGDGPLKSALDRAVADLNLAARVRFLGEVPHDDLPALYRRATICALSSRHEAQSVVVLEAAACGVVTVGTAVGILPELAPVCRAVPVGDHQALAVAMAAALDDPEARRRLAGVARNLVERAYSIEHTAAALCGIYERLVASRELRSTGVTSPDEQGARER